MGQVYEASDHGNLTWGQSAVPYGRDVDLVGAHEIRAMLGVSKQRAYQITRQKGFPDPVVRLAQGAVWRRADVERWIRANRPALDDDER